MSSFDRAPLSDPGPVTPEVFAIAGASDAARPTVSAADVTESLRAVVDPELGLSVVDLGLIYGIDVRGATVAITMTLTAPGCPLHEVMPGWVREAVKSIPGVERVEVALSFEPPWTPERISLRS